MSFDIKKWKKLYWDDFSGVVKPFSPFGASIHSDIYVEFDSVSKTFKAYAGQNNLKSWVKKGLESDMELLRHEQYHFDITEYHARLMNKFLKEENIKSINQYKYRLENIKEQLTNMQDRYDQETEHSLNEENQKKWENKIDNLLNRENIHDSIKINFPKLDNWKETYHYKTVKERFDNILNTDITKVLAVYLPNRIEKLKDSIEYIDLNEYAIFTTIKDKLKWKINNEDLKKEFDYSKNKNSLKYLNLDSLAAKVFIDTTYIQSKRIYIIEDYYKRDNTYSALLINKPYSDDHEYIMVYETNIINVKGQLILGAYYQLYEDIGTIQEVKYHNEKIITEFLNSNK